MFILPILKNSIKTMRANPARTGLAVLGIVIGIAAVIIVFSAGEGIRSLVVGQVESFGSDFIETELRVPQKSSSNKTSSNAQSGIDMATGVQITTLTLDDMEAINKLSNIKVSYGALLSQNQISYSSEMRKGFIMGVSADYINIDNGKIAQGRFFTDAEDKSLAQVVVLGSKMKVNLFGDSDAVGKDVRIKKDKYKVIGVMKEKGAVMGMDFDSYSYIPVRTLQKKILGVDHVMYMIHKLNDVSKSDSTAEEIRILLRERHDITDPARDDFNVITMKEMLDILNTIASAITLLLLAIVAVSLLVGGVGILNVMYVAVVERTPEIGLRKSIGARRSDIIMQFLIESIIISVVGGAIGSALGSIISIIIYLVANQVGFDWPLAIPIRAFVVALSFSAFCGIIFGVWPARQAGRLDPVEALRKE